jgi:hypothetical protein
MIVVKLLLYCLVEFDYTIRHAQLVISRSILFGCDIHPEERKSSVENIFYLDRIASQLEEFKKMIR